MKTIALTALFLAFAAAEMPANATELRIPDRANSCEFTGTLDDGYQGHPNIICDGTILAVDRGPVNSERTSRARSALNGIFQAETCMLDAGKLICVYSKRVR